MESNKLKLFEDILKTKMINDEMYNKIKDILNQPEKEYTDKEILSDLKLANYITDKDKLLKLIKENPKILLHMREDFRNPEFYIEVVKQNGFALRYVKEQTLEICLAAVKQEGCVLLYVKKQTPEICLAAVKQDGWVLRHIKEQTLEICLAAVKQNGFALQFVREDLLTFELCMAAVEKNKKISKYINVSYKPPEVESSDEESDTDDE